MQQQKNKPATLDDLTNTLDYTFIDLPELVDGKWFACRHSCAPAKPGLDHCTGLSAACLSHVARLSPVVTAASDDADSYIDPESHMDAAQHAWHMQPQPPQARQQQQLQQAHLQQHSDAGSSHKYVEMPFWQQLQQGAQSQTQQPVLGPLGQALAAAMQGNPQASRQAMQPRQEQQQQQQQYCHQQQQHAWQPAGSFGSAEAQQSAAG
jgi:hypothetical protein